MLPFCWCLIYLPWFLAVCSLLVSSCLGANNFVNVTAQLWPGAGAGAALTCRLSTCWQRWWWWGPQQRRHGRERGRGRGRWGRSSCVPHVNSARQKRIRRAAAQWAWCFAQVIDAAGRSRGWLLHSCCNDLLQIVKRTHIYTDLHTYVLHHIGVCGRSPVGCCCI